MEITSKPETVDALDVDFTFVGNIQSQVTLFESKGDTLDVTDTQLHIGFGSGANAIHIERRNLLFYETRKRKVELKPKPPKPETVPATPPTGA